MKQTAIVPGRTCSRKKHLLSDTSLFVGAMLASGVCCLRAGEAIHFNRDIRPILSENCHQCHGPDENKRKGELRLDQEESALADRGGYAAIVLGRPESSELMKRITAEDPAERMPPVESDKSLTPQQIELIRLWIQQGAKYERHWSFIPPQRPQVPKVAKRELTKNAIDNFVVRRLEKLGIASSREADRRTLIRRVSFDLIGLPPTIGEVRAFVNDRRMGAFERVVNRLLLSPHYGERMAQDWLDNARYADTTGFAADTPRTMWLYRDWVINAHNRNMPFDQFTIEQLAGDMLPDATETQKIATGFHRNSMQALGNNPRKEEFRVKGIVDRLDTTGRVWLGSTFACAECHDHKYDPITQREYYQLFAIFNNVPHHGEAFEIHGPRMNVTVPSHGAVTAQVMEELPTPRETHVHIRGNFENKGELVAPGVPDFLGDLPDGASDDRLGFARWLVDGKHPLVARVIVNRFWQHFFGIGIVRTVEDFGAQGEWPSHPDLLDWLAVEFVECGWDVRHINKLIVMSATYRQSSHVSAALLERDSYNRLLARGPRYRLAAEQIRDNVLAVSGLLNRRVGGPSVYPVQPSHIGEFRDETAGQWKVSRSADRYRRALYTFWQRMYPYPSLQIFDAPSRERCVLRRERSNTPLQALVTLNDPAFFVASRAFGQRIVEHGAHRTDSARLKFAFESALARPPGQEEQQMFLAFIRKQRERCAKVAQPELAVWTLVASTLFNLDETFNKQ